MNALILLAVALALDVSPHGDASLVEQGVDEKTKAPYWVLEENGEKVRLKCRSPKIPAKSASPTAIRASRRSRRRRSARPSRAFSP